MIDILKAYQSWRRGDDDRTLEATGLTPAMIGEAIDWAIGVAEERDALKAQLDTLQKAIYRQQRKEGWYEEHPLVTLCIATPEHCLAEIKSKAGRDGFIEGVSSRACDYMTSQEVQKEAEQYANQIRQNANPLSKVNKARYVAKVSLDNWIEQENKQ